LSPLRSPLIKISNLKRDKRLKRIFRARKFQKSSIRKKKKSARKKKD
jgi:hypothetical protein